MAYNKETADRKRKYVYEKTNGFCIYCGCQLDFIDFHMEHIIPKSINSGSSVDRLFPSCPLCNLIKHDKTIDDFRKKIEEDIFNSSHVKLAVKYHKLKKRKVVFYFEREKIDIYG